MRYLGRGQREEGEAVGRKSDPGCHNALEKLLQTWDGIWAKALSLPFCVTELELVLVDPVQETLRGKECSARAVR